MILIGCDFHPAWQQVCWVNTETGEICEKKLVHEAGEVEKFYGRFAAPALIGLEATGNCQWFLDLLERLGHTVWIGDAAKIRASEVRRQKNDRRDAELLLKLLIQGRFPRLWVPSSEQRDERQLLHHRQRLVWMRVQVKNELQHLALNQGLQKKRRLWSAAGQKLLSELALSRWAGRRREDLLRLLKLLDEQIAPLDQAAQQAAEQNPQARLLMTHPGVGPITALAFVLIIGEVSRFPRGKQVASYLGLIPREYSSGGHQHLGPISKQGNRFLRMLLVEAAQAAVRCDPQMRREYLHRCHGKPKGVAQVAAARKLAVRLYWMLRTQTAYPGIVHVESSPRVPLVVRPGE